jgi:ribosomal protein S18 acetylase RimI-like enzyme
MTTSNAAGVKDRLPGAPVNLRPSDWSVLRDVIRESITESPKAFLTTLEQVKSDLPDFWEDKLRSAMWVVAQRGDRIVGVASAKRPGTEDTYADPVNACFIESVWIDPKVRECGVGGRLVTFLIEQQRGLGIEEFYLWVLDRNSPALNFYKRLGFTQTGQPSELAETQFFRRFEKDVVLPVLAGQEIDRGGFGVTYRTLAG